MNEQLDLKAWAGRMNRKLETPDNLIEAPIRAAKIADAKGLLLGIAEGSLLTGQARIALDIMDALASNEPGLTKPLVRNYSSVLVDCARAGLSVETLPLAPYATPSMRR